MRAVRSRSPPFVVHASRVHSDCAGGTPAPQRAQPRQITTGAGAASGTAAAFRGRDGGSNPASGRFGLCASTCSHFALLRLCVHSGGWADPVSSIRSFGHGDGDGHGDGSSPEPIHSPPPPTPVFGAGAESRRQHARQTGRTPRQACRRGQRAAHRGHATRAPFVGPHG